jgi:ubiquinone/menaquinone biosynthesis C-methylase UbiE
VSEFDFSNSAATNYDTLLVPIIFKPWAEHFLDTRSDWEGKTVLDMACGTGIVSSLLPDKVGAQGTIYSVDINADMLAVAKQRCEGSPTPIHFIESGADAIEFSDDSIDVIVCQQGFQFFPDKPAAAAQMHRVLRPGGGVMISTWRNIEECDAFNVIVQALESIGEPETGDLMRIPFDFMPPDTLEEAFTSAGFDDVAVETVSRPMTMNGGIEQAIQAVYGTPIAPKLNGLSEEKQTALNEKLGELYAQLASEGNTYGKLRTNLLTAVK